TQPGGKNQYIHCGNSNVIERNNGSSSAYHSLQSHLDLRDWHHMTSSVSYTWSHTIDTTSEVFSRTNAGALAVSQNPFDLRPERGRSGIDFPNNLAVQFIYDIPYYRSQQGWLGHLL